LPHGSRKPRFSRFEIKRLPQREIARPIGRAWIETSWRVV